MCSNFVYVMKQPNIQCKHIVTYFKFKTAIIIHQYIIFIENVFKIKTNIKMLKIQDKSRNLVWRMDQFAAQRILLTRFNIVQNSFKIFLKDPNTNINFSSPKIAVFPRTILQFKTSIKSHPFFNQLSRSPYFLYIT